MQAAQIHQTPDTLEQSKNIEAIVAELNRISPGWFCCLLDARKTEFLSLRNVENYFYLIHKDPHFWIHHLLKFFAYQLGGGTAGAGLASGWPAMSWANSSPPCGKTVSLAPLLTTF